MKWSALALIGCNLLSTNGEFQSVTARRTSLSIGDFVDTEACYSAIEGSVADRDGDQEMDPEAYVDFIKAYGPDDLLEDGIMFQELPLLLINNFYLLACQCEETIGGEECCVGTKAGIETNGAFSGQTPTNDEKSYLFLVCSQTSTAIDRMVQSMSPSGVPIGSPSPTNDSIIEQEVVVNYLIGVKNTASSFEDYNEELRSAMDSMAPTLLLEARRRQLRAGRNLQSVFLPTSIIDNTVVGKSVDFLLTGNDLHTKINSKVVSIPLAISILILES